jgi:lysophospholipase L1-like esterase
MKKHLRILCFGDSNTYGWDVTHGNPAYRYPSHIRWTGILAHMLGSQCSVLEEGLGGRTLKNNFTVGSGLSLPGAGLCGKDYLPACLLSHLPLDLVIFMLGSNDMKSALRLSAEDIAQGMEELVDIVQTFPWQGLLAYPHPDIVIISPPLIGERKMKLAGERYANAPEKSRQLAKLYQNIAQDKHTLFLDAAQILAYTSPFGEAHGIDGMHLNEEDHAHMAEALYHLIQKHYNANNPSAGK